jgi:hypothetical protein
VVFGVLATTFCPSAIRNALSASGAVRVRDVMVNVPHRLVQKSPAGLFCYELAIFSCEFFIGIAGNDSNLLIVFYVQIVPDDFVMQLHRF